MFQAYFQRTYFATVACFINISQVNWPVILQHPVSVLVFHSISYWEECWHLRMWLCAYLFLFYLFWLVFLSFFLIFKFYDNNMPAFGIVISSWWIGPFLITRHLFLNIRLVYSWTSLNFCPNCVVTFNVCFLWELCSWIFKEYQIYKSLS